ncbi:MAG: RidA family protein [Clostridia bacterium]
MKKSIFASNAPGAIGPYSHSNVIGNLVFTSGQLGMDPANGKLRDGVEAQARQALLNLEAVLKASGASFNTVVKTTVFVKDLADFATVNKIYGESFNGEFPARSCVQVAALPAGGLVEIEAIAEVE